MASWLVISLEAVWVEMRRMRRDGESWDQSGGSGRATMAHRDQ